MTVRDVQSKSPSVAFTVVIPTHNGRGSLLQAVESVLGQSYPHFELIVVSDGNGDVAREILSNVCDPRLTILELPLARGVAAARNLGISAATHSWVTFLDDDDIARSYWLATWSSAITETTLAATGRVEYHRPGLEPHSRTCRLSPEDGSMNASSILAGGFAVRREVLEAIGGYDLGLHAATNQDLGLRLCDHLSDRGGSERVSHCDEVVVDVFVEPQEGRSRRYGTSRSDAAKILLDRYSCRLLNDSAGKASLLRIIAHGERLKNNHRAAATSAIRACVIEPTNFQNWTSLVSAFLPRSLRDFSRHTVGISN